MPSPFDAPVLDRVFQPLADRLTAHDVSIFQTARFFLDGATLTLVLGAMVWGVSRHGLDPVVMATSAAVITALVLVMTVFYRRLIASIERLHRPGMVNIGRHALTRTRIIALALTLQHLLRLNPDWAGVLDAIGFAFLAISSYFASCSTRPPQHRSARKAAWWKFQPA